MGKRKAESAADEGDRPKKKRLTEFSPQKDGSMKRESDFLGVEWDTEISQTNPWRASVFHENEHHLAGYFPTEQQAAMAVNAQCDELKIARKNPSVGACDLQSVNNDDKNDDGYVCLQKRSQGWTAAFEHKSKRLKCYKVVETREEAAEMLNACCDRIGIPHKNPAAGVSFVPEKFARKFPLPGLQWLEECNAWKLTVEHGGGTHFVGLYPDEFAAVHAMNAKCITLGIPKAHPQYGIGDFHLAHIKCMPSIYRNVLPSGNTRFPWKAQLERKHAKIIRECKKCKKLGFEICRFLGQPGHLTLSRLEKKAQIFNGVFITETEAAIAVNILAAKRALPLPNPKLGTNRVYCTKHNLETKFPEVTWTRDGFFKAGLHHNGLLFPLGRYDSIEDALKAVNQKCLHLCLPEKYPEHGVGQISRHFQPVPIDSKSDLQSEKDPGFSLENHVDGVQCQNCKVWRNKMTESLHPSLSNRGIMVCFDCFVTEVKTGKLPPPVVKKAEEKTTKKKPPGESEQEFVPRGIPELESIPGEKQTSNEEEPPTPLSIQTAPAASESLAEDSISAEISSGSGEPPPATRTTDEVSPSTHSTSLSLGDSDSESVMDEEMESQDEEMSIRDSLHTNDNVDEGAGSTSESSSGESEGEEYGENGTCSDEESTSESDEEWENSAPVETFTNDAAKNVLEGEADLKKVHAMEAQLQEDEDLKKVHAMEAQLQEEGIYHVEKILTHMIKNDGEIHFYVKWRGFGDDENSWVIQTDMADGALKRQYAMQYLRFQNYSEHDDSSEYPPITTRVRMAVQALSNTDQYSIKGATKLAISKWMADNFRHTSKSEIKSGLKAAVRDGLICGLSSGKKKTSCRYKIGNNSAPRPDISKVKSKRERKKPEDGKLKPKREQKSSEASKSSVKQQEQKKKKRFQLKLPLSPKLKPLDPNREWSDSDNNLLHELMTRMEEKKDIFLSDVAKLLKRSESAVSLRWNTVRSRPRLNWLIQANPPLLQMHVEQKVDTTFMMKVPSKPSMKHIRETVFLQGRTRSERHNKLKKEIESQMAIDAAIDAM